MEALVNMDVPRRGIYSDVDMKHFMESSTKKELLSFVEAMGRSCAFSEQGDEGPAFTPDTPLEGLTPSMACLHGALRQMITWVDDFPPVNQDLARFGNPAFRQWHARLLSRSNSIVAEILKCRDGDISNPEASNRGSDAAAGKTTSINDEGIQQVSCYLHDSFGHATRLDYGTGHESSFLVFLLVLTKVKCLGQDVPPPIPTLRATTLAIFDQYLKVTRRLQTDYRFEPAGSHGVWGLDDYHCLPFYFGACQLQAQSRFKTLGLECLSHPNVVNDIDILKEYSDQFLYFACIRYIRQLKQGVPFFESSPMLYDISQTMSTWDKVARGMLRLYQGEVLDKRQVVQHFVFSKLFPMTWQPSQLTERQAPTEMFRSGPSSQHMPETRAPWASQPLPGHDGNSTSDLARTRAHGSTAGEDPMAPTKAPWAK
jgi:serine/threonine-protein phosphatase 2A activator